MQKKINKLNKIPNRKVIYKYIKSHKLPIINETRYNSFILAKFINSITFHGKRYLAYKFFYLFLFYIKFKLKKNPIYSIFTVLDSLKPILHYKKILKETQKKATTNQVFCFPLTNRKAQLLLSIKLLSNVVKKHKRKINKKTNLINEVISILLNPETETLNKKYNIYNEFSNNRVISNFRWADKKSKKGPSFMEKFIYREQKYLIKGYKDETKKKK